MTSLRKTLFALFLIFSPLVASFADNSKYEMSAEQLKKQLSQVSVSKDQVRSMVDLLVAQGKITPQMGEKTKKELENLSEGELQTVINKAMSHLKTNGKDSLRNMGIDDLLKSAE